MLQPFMQGMQQALQNMTPEDMARMREMLRDLNRMLRERAEGGEPDFEAFMDKWGQHFPGVETSISSSSSSASRSRRCSR